MRVDWTVLKPIPRILGMRGLVATFVRGEEKA